MLKSEGDHLLKSLGKLGTHTTHGVCRAVNVTGNAAAVVAGGVFKIAGAAILDGVGEEPSNVVALTGRFAAPANIVHQKHVTKTADISFAIRHSFCFLGFFSLCHYRWHGVRQRPVSEGSTRHSRYVRLW